jgi:RNA polymerase sigma factor for flagellar operon FliA
MPGTSMESASHGRREHSTEYGFPHTGLPPALRSSVEVLRPTRGSLRARTPAEDSSSSAAAKGSAQFSDCKESLLAEHVPMVRLIARGIHSRLPQHVELDDLVSAGMVGLLDALHKFDMSKKVQFRSYAQFRIRGAILDSLRALDWSPRYLRRKARAVEEASRMLRARIGESPTELEVARELRMELGEYQQLLAELKGLEIGTLHAERLEDSGDDEMSCIPSRPEDDPLFLCLRGEVHQRMADAIRELPERERLVMTLYYYEELTMREIGLAMQVVESRVSQIHASALMHLRLLVADMSTWPARQQGEPSRAQKGRQDATAAIRISQFPIRGTGANLGTTCFLA